MNATDSTGTAPDAARSRTRGTTRDDALPEDGPGTGRRDTRLLVRDLDVELGGARVLHGVDLVVAPGTVTAIVGPNGCGKSTLLRTAGRLLRPHGGSVLLDGRDVFRRPSRELALELGVLPQTPTAPEGLTVVDLVSRGRDPHRRWYDQWSRSDEEVVMAALERTGMTDLADAVVDELSGGQRQRAWIAMAVAQGAGTLLLDEPTTYLDVAHQLDVLDLVRSMNAEAGTTVVMVLHDLSSAARYADRVVAMRGGRVVVEGTPEEVVTPRVLREVFDIVAEVVPDPVTGRPHVLPVRRCLPGEAAADR